MRLCSLWASPMGAVWKFYQGDWAGLGGQRVTRFPGRGAVARREHGCAVGRFPSLERLPAKLRRAHESRLLRSTLAARGHLHRLQSGHQQSRRLDAAATGAGGQRYRVCSGLLSAGHGAGSPGNRHGRGASGALIHQGRVEVGNRILTVATCQDPLSRPPTIRAFLYGIMSQGEKLSSDHARHSIQNRV